mgnify:CR=1 FL=1
MRKLQTFYLSGNVSLSRGGTMFSDLPKASILSGKHSDQGSMIPEIRQDIRSRKKMSGHLDRVLAQNFDTVLAGIVIWVGDIAFAFLLPRGVETHSKAPIRETQIQGLKYMHSYDKGSRNYTRHIRS